MTRLIKMTVAPFVACHVLRHKGVVGICFPVAIWESTSEFVRIVCDRLAVGAYTLDDGSIVRTFESELWTEVAALIARDWHMGKRDSARNEKAVS